MLTIRMLHVNMKKMRLSVVHKIQEVFHVYLNKFENAITHLFLVILGNN